MTDRKLFPVLGIDQPDVPAFILRMCSDRDAHPSKEASVAGWEYLPVRARYIISPNLLTVGFLRFQGDQQRRKAAFATCSDLSARLRTAASRQPADSGFPQPGIEKIFHALTCDSGEIRMRVGEDRFLYNSGSSGSSPARDRSCRRQALGSSPFRQTSLPSPFPMRMPDVAIFGCVRQIRQLFEPIDSARA